MRVNFDFERVRKGSLPDDYVKSPTMDLLRTLERVLMASDLPEPLPSRDDWNKAAGPWIAPDRYLTVLESWMLTSVRRDLEPKKETQQAARLWASLASPVPWNGIASHDLHYRWHPIEPGANDRFSENDAVVLVRAIEALRGASYAVPFPVVKRLDGEPFLIECRVSLLMLDEADKSNFKPVVLAPWSEFLPRPENIERLAEALSECGKIVSEQRFLLEFSKLKRATSPDSVTIIGNSLDLAIVLAAHAAREQPVLLPIVSTGTIKKAGAIVPVYIGKKWLCVQEYAERSEQVVLFVLPSGMEAPALHGSKWVKIVHAPENVADLPAWIRDRLSDGCDHYRTHFSGLRAIDAVSDDAESPATELTTFDPGDVTSLDVLGGIAMRSQVLRAGEPLPVQALPFGNDPRQAARHVARVLIHPTRVSQEEDLASQVTALDRAREDVVVPLLFPLYADEKVRPEDRGTVVEELVWHLRQGLLDTQVLPDRPPAPVAGKVNLIREDVLHNLLVHFHNRLLFLIYDRSSLELDYELDDKKRVEGLLDGLRKYAPGAQAVFIASDWHHYAWLKAMGVALRNEASNA
jgi:hypothetical protein